MSNNGLLCMCVGIYLVIVRVKTGAVLSLIVTDHINIDYCKGRKHQAKTFLRWCQKKKKKKRPDELAVKAFEMSERAMGT